MTFVPMGIGSLRPIIERTYRESHPLQFLRELVTNSLEAKATRIEIGPHHHIGETQGIWRFMARDNGHGMSGSQMLSYLNNFGKGGKSIGGYHENFGIGSKTSLLPWNRAGMVVISYTKESQRGNMIKLKLDENSGEYGLGELKDGAVVCEPFDDGVVDWASLRPEWMTTGTIVMLMGNTGTESTYLEVCSTVGQPKIVHSSMTWAVSFLSQRYWRFDEGVNISVFYFNNRPDPDARGRVKRSNNPMVGSEPHAIALSESRGCVELPDKTKVWWFLRERGKEVSQLRGFRGGAVGALYKNELYDVRTHHNTLKKFGLVGKTRSRTILIFEPCPIEDGVGAYPDAARSHLIMKSAEDSSSVGLPWDLWSDWFRDRLPIEIIESMVNDQVNNGDEVDDAWAERLKSNYGSRWTFTKPVRSNKGEEAELGEVDSPVDPEEKDSGLPKPSDKVEDQGEKDDQDAQLSLANLGKIKRRFRRKATTGDVPDAIWVEEDWAPSNSIAASYTKPSKAHPAGLVELNWNHRIFQEMFCYWCAQYQSQAHIQQQIKNTVKSVYKRHAQTTIAHAHSFEKSFKLDELLSDVSLTCSLMGIYAQDQEIMMLLSKSISPQSRLVA